MGIKDSAKGISDKLRLGPHYGIERFGVMFASLAVITVLLAVSVIGSAMGNNRHKAEGTALYTPSFITSKTQLPGTVAGIYVSPDRKRSMALMKFEDASGVSYNAENYQAFMTGSDMSLNTERIKTNLSGNIVVFGTTGYLGMVLDSDEPFAQQILGLTMRANSELVYTKENSADLRSDLKDDTSFARNDQWKIFFNPGAKEAIEAPALAGRSIDAGKLYAELVIKADEDKVRGELDKQLAQMRIDLNRIAEFKAEMARTNVDGVFIEPPVEPKEVAGDKITGDLPVDGKGSTLELETSWVSQRGYAFDWRKTTVQDGYLKDLVPSGESFVTFLADKAKAGKVDGSTPETGLAVNEIKWELTNGKNLVEDYDPASTAMKPLVDIMNNLSQAYQDYYDHKLAYQTTTLNELLELEVGLRNVDSGQSVHSGEDALLTY